ncbi:MAG: T9SS type A sorting domain-containing protein [Bacteroidota bacterium]
MKKHLLLSFLFILQVVVGWSQLPVFNNASEDNNLYSNPDNWADTNKPGDNDQAQFNGRAQLDETVTLSYIRASVMNAGLLNGSGTLTLTGGDGTFVDIQQFTTGEFLIDVPVIYTATDPPGRNLFRVDTDGGTISFGPNSDLDVGAIIRLQGFPGSSAFGRFNFDGILRGTQNIQLGVNIDTVFFGSTSDNSNYTGQIIFFSPGSTIVANNEDRNVLVAPDNKIQVNNNNGSLVLNGADIYYGYLQIDGANTLRWEINADQAFLQRLDIPAAGTINMVLGNEVDTVHFSHIESNNSERNSAWNAAASLNIENFKNAALRFGTTNAGLTVDQLAQINIGGNAVTLNSNGFLIDPTLNSAPGGTIDNLSLAAGFSTRQLDLSDFIQDAENDNITYSEVTSSAVSFVTVSLNGSLLTLNEVGSGTSIISVTATDENGASAQITFTATVDQLPDADGDGVTDVDDLCPNTPSGENVDGDGCSESQKDDDNDGVFNTVDLCPGTPIEEQVDTDGCADSQKDSDGDGVTDDNDVCPSTSQGESVDAIGCPILSSISTDAALSIYPNPVEDVLTVEGLSELSEGTISVFDMSGKSVMEHRIQSGKNQLRLNRLTKGGYILRINDGVEIMTFRIQKSR